MTKGQVDMAKLKHQSNHTDFKIHTCILNFFEGDSCKNTKKSKNIIVLHYYANYTHNII